MIVLNEQEDTREIDQRSMQAAVCSELWRRANWDVWLFLERNGGSGRVYIRLGDMIRVAWSDWFLVQGDETAGSPHQSDEAECGVSWG
jgi:hypothetical protein|uniref:Uncharacterized protein n=1 Tax=Oryza sativa subsp. japonica TaxID=39947 RepID=Q6K6P9_ORYSJ|nr:hypothetical protein [Oryza sativa Japonica Group]